MFHLNSNSLFSFYLKKKVHAFILPSAQFQELEKGANYFVIADEL